MLIMFALAVGTDSYPRGMLQYWYRYFSTTKILLFYMTSTLRFC